jgi:MraZ protein
MGKSGAKWRRVVQRAAPEQAGQGETMFRGQTKVTIDSKGRLAMPTRYRDRIAERSNGRLIATIDLTDKCVLIYTAPEWEEFERKLQKLPGLKPSSRRLLRLMVGSAAEIELDAQGRVLLPANLREHAGITRQALLVGQLNRFELWDETLWNEQLKLDDGAEDLSPELEALSL